jgi:hypothetical protein
MVIKDMANLPVWKAHEPERSPKTHRDGVFGLLPVIAL